MQLKSDNFMYKHATLSKKLFSYEILPVMKTEVRKISSMVTEAGKQ